MNSYQMQNAPSYDDAIVIDTRDMADQAMASISATKGIFMLLLIFCIEMTVSITAWFYRPQYSSYVTYMIQTADVDSVDTMVAASLGGSLQDTIEDSGLMQQIEEQFQNKERWIRPNMFTPAFDSSTNYLTITIATNNYYNTLHLTEAFMNVYEDYVTSVMGSTQIEVADYMPVNSSPDQPYSLFYMILLGTAAGIVAYAIFLVLYGLCRRTVRTREDMKRLSSLKCLQEVGMVAGNNQNGINYHSGTKNTLVFEQDIRTLRSRIMRKMQQKEEKILMIASSIGKEGKTTLAVNLALAIAEKGKKVLLVDTNFYHPGLMEILPVNSKARGFSDYLQGTAELTNLIVTKDGIDIIYQIEKLDNSRQILKHNKLQEFVDYVSERYDYVILDTAAAANYADVDILSDFCQAVLYVVRYDYAGRRSIENGLQSIHFADIDFLGYVLNGIRHFLDVSDKYSYQKYGYYYSRERKKNE